MTAEIIATFICYFLSGLICYWIGYAVGKGVL